MSLDRSRVILYIFLNVSLNDAVSLWRYVASETDEWVRNTLECYWQWENWSTRWRVCHFSTLCTKTPTSSGLGSNRATFNEKRMTNRLNHDKAGSCFSLFCYLYTDVTVDNVQERPNICTQQTKQSGKVYGLFNWFLFRNLACMPKILTKFLHGFPQSI